MRVSILLALTGSALLFTACSADDGSSAIRRRAPSDSRAAPAKTAPAPDDGTRGGSSPSPTPTPPPSDPPPPVTPDAGPSTPSSTPPAPGSCGNPKCFGVGGFGGCKATNSAGASVAMGCQDGACACVAGGATTATFDGNVGSASDAAQLFMANCDCN